MLHYYPERGKEESPDPSLSVETLEHRNHRKLWGKNQSNKKNVH